ncbi:MAG: ABC transporter ATP-binding protein [Firmicutes bacterium]|nr:ABC transporter ATP-binding protein [Bacillota bacterium]
MKLTIQNLRNSFDQKLVLNQVNMQIKNGEFVAILGPSGCGKSTILNILAGLIQPDAGIIQVDGKEVKGVSDHFAYMPQSDLLLPWKTILENVTLYGQINKDKKNATEKALKEFKTFGLDGYQNAYPRELSGGMRQRAAFLRTALCNADILLLDEPFGALDVITRNDMQDWLLNLRDEYNRTTLLVTHDIDEALYLADRILILSHRPASIIREIDLSNVEKSRDWLFSQGALKQDIFELLKGENNA